MGLISRVSSRTYRTSFGYHVKSKLQNVSPPRSSDVERTKSGWTQMNLWPSLMIIPGITSVVTSKTVLSSKSKLPFTLGLGYALLMPPGGWEGTLVLVKGAVLLTPGLPKRNYG